MVGYGVRSLFPDALREIEAAAAEESLAETADERDAVSYTHLRAHET